MQVSGHKAAVAPGNTPSNILEGKVPYLFFFPSPRRTLKSVEYDVPWEGPMLLDYILITGHQVDLKRWYRVVHGK